MPSFSTSSKNKLSTCDIKLQDIMNEVILKYDIAIICGYRNEAEQSGAYKNGKSDAQFPHSKHNTYPSKAIDITPFPIDWKDTKRFYEMAAFVLEVACSQGIYLKWGGNWILRKVSKRVDLPHFELGVKVK